MLLRRIYFALPLPPAIRQRISLWRRQWLNRRRANLSRDEQTLEVEAPTGSSPDYLFFGVIDWHFRHQRPQQLALALARQQRRVFYFSVNLIEARDSGFAIERIHDELPIYQVQLKACGIASVYDAPATSEQYVQLRAGLRALWTRAGISRAVSVVQHPFWHALADGLAAAREVYDCMDLHAGFENTATEYAPIEQELLRRADAVVVTSAMLENLARPLARRIGVVRNAADFDHFHGHASAGEAAASTNRSGPTVLGYYGAIAQWFDIGLIDALAQAFPECDIRLIGADTAGVRQALAHRRNVRLLGEKPYGELPQWLEGFDVCLIPFRVVPLTMATNPVKVYEYLSAGKAVVATDLPELALLGDLVRRASGSAEFIDEVRAAIAESQHSEIASLRARRVEFARHQTWQQRAEDFAVICEDEADEPSVSVIVVSYNQWSLTARCLESIEATRGSARIEVVVVDNGSSDETPQQLRAWQAGAPERRKIMLSPDNLGFAAGVNRGALLAQGDYLVILNNDTIVSPGWTRGLRRHFERDPGLGVICPVTNNIGNEARVPLAGSTPQAVLANALGYCLDRAGQRIDLNVAAFFCVMIPRRIWVSVGPMDEQFFPGFFEDDDYCIRVREAGWSIGCAEDVFVYHELSASFNAESAQRRKEIFERNKVLFEKKWGPWKPHAYRK